MESGTKLSLGVLTVVSLLAGCSSAPTYPTHDFTSDLKEPRPFSTEVSYATRKFRLAFGGFTDYVVNSVADTAIWEDEEGLVLGGFDFTDTYESVYRPAAKGAYSQDAKKKLLESVVKKYGTVPYAIRNLMPADSQESTMKLLGDSWYYSGFGSSEFTLGGMGFALASNLFSYDVEDWKRIQTEHEIKKLSTLTHLSYGLTDGDKKEAEKLGFGEVLPGTIQQAQFSQFLGKKILATLADAVKEQGYTVVGDMITWKSKESDETIYYALEGNSCPKAMSKPWKNNCYVRIGIGISEKKPVDIWVNDTSDCGHLVFDIEGKGRRFYHPGLSKEKTGEVYDKILATLKKRPNITVYYPSESVNGKWQPQRIEDSNGIHYFTVSVKRR